MRIIFYTAQMASTTTYSLKATHLWNRSSYRKVGKHTPEEQGSGCGVSDCPGQLVVMIIYSLMTSSNTFLTVFF